MNGARILPGGVNARETFIPGHGHSLDHCRLFVTDPEEGLLLAD
jgi:hypothetical protein